MLPSLLGNGWANGTPESSFELRDKQPGQLKTLLEKKMTAAGKFNPETIISCARAEELFSSYLAARLTEEKEKSLLRRRLSIFRRKQKGISHCTFCQGDNGLFLTCRKL